MERRALHTHAHTHTHTHTHARTHTHTHTHCGPGGSSPQGSYDQTMPPRGATSGLPPHLPPLLQQTVLNQEPPSLVYNLHSHNTPYYNILAGILITIAGLYKHTLTDNHIHKHCVFTLCQYTNCVHAYLLTTLFPYTSSCLYYSYAECLCRRILIY